MNTVGYQKDLALFVMLYTCALIVLSTIQLDTELVCMAVEVKDIRTNRVLTTKLQTTKLTATQTVPQEFFCVSLLTTQLTHKCEIFWG